MLRRRLSYCSHERSVPLARYSGLSRSSLSSKACPLSVGSVKLDTDGQKSVLSTLRTSVASEASRYRSNKTRLSYDVPLPITANQIVAGCAQEAVLCKAI